MIEKELPQGILQLTQRLADNPTSRAFVPLADLYLKHNLLEEAILVLTEGLQRHPTYVAARMMLGNAYLRAEQIPEAKREFEEVVRVHPENVLAYKKLALLYKESGQLGDAVALCTKVLLIDPHDKRAKWLLALAQEEISALDDRGSDFLPEPPFAIPPSSPVSDWPQPPYEETVPSLAEVVPLAEDVPSFETEIAEQFPDGVPVTDDSLQGGYLPATETPLESVPLGCTELPLESAPVGGQENEGVLTESPLEEIPLEFAGKTVYNRSMLHQIRLKEWLVSIQEKRVRPIRGVRSLRGGSR